MERNCSKIPKEQYFKLRSFMFPSSKRVIIRFWMAQVSSYFFLWLDVECIEQNWWSTMCLPESFFSGQLEFPQKLVILYFYVNLQGNSLISIIYLIQLLQIEELRNEECGAF
ncbi:unnamed protein product [Paramecium octaurelia]|uniref:Uncharacterized protein n=1 Tax=Paramecium octaurelia TaxID=43137 RepID=A0A8S1YHZ5_PAROT|nr:unnamed protein product [Paramecium octaurelia]